MPKLIGFIRRRHDLDLAAFSHHWRTTHRGHAEKLSPWLRGYAQNHLYPGPIADVQRPADGCPVLWLDDLADVPAMIASTAFREGAYLDEPCFMEGRSSGLAVEEEVRQPGTGAVKLMLFLGLNPGARAGDFWPVAHASGWVRNHRLPGQLLDPACDFDLVDEIWWSDLEAFAADRAGAPHIAACDWAALHRLKAAMVEELVVFPPTR
jgi:ribosomal protein S18 acetylase RimI-like enzyme